MPESRTSSYSSLKYKIRKELACVKNSEAHGKIIHLLKYREKLSAGILNWSMLEFPSRLNLALHFPIKLPIHVVANKYF